MIESSFNELINEFLCKETLLFFVLNIFVRDKDQRIN